MQVFDHGDFNMPMLGTPSTIIPGATEYALPPLVEQALAETLRRTPLLDTIISEQTGRELAKKAFASTTALSRSPFSRFLGWVGVGLTAYEIYEWLSDLEWPNAPYTNSGGWIFDEQCRPSVPDCFRQTAVIGTATCVNAIYNVGDPLPSPGYEAGWTWPVVTTPLVRYLDHNEFQPSNATYGFRRTIYRYRKPANVVTTGIAPFTTLQREVNPNLRYYLQPRVFTDGSEIPLQTEQPAPQLQTQSSPEGAVKTTVSVSANGQPKTQTVLAAPSWPKPPRAREKERKVRSWGVKFWAMIDTISEASEVVDAFFEALPENVKKKWKKANERGTNFIDQAGQYGIGGADWKLQALYHNWDKVDMGEAITNLAYNHIEDKVIGNIQRKLPKQSAPVDNLALGEYGKLADDWRSAFQDFVLQR